MEAKFKIGDVVRLKSGSPAMTVEQVLRTGDVVHVDVVYFNVENRSNPPTYGELQKQSFKEEALTDVKM